MRKINKIFTLLFSITAFVSTLNCFCQPITFERHTTLGPGVPKDVIELADSSLAISGNYWTSSNLGYALVARLTSSGNTIWGRNYYYQNNPLAGTIFDVLCQNLAGNIVIGGRSGGALLLIELDKMGDTLWTKMYDITGGISVRDIQVAPDSGYFLLLNYSNSAFLVKTDGFGDIQWSKDYKNGTTSTNPVKLISLKNYGHLIVADSGGPLLIAIDSTGNVLWDKHYWFVGGFQTGWVAMVPDSSFVFSAYHSGPGLPCIFKLDANGDTIWTRYYNWSGQGFFRLGPIVSSIDGGYVVLGRCDTNLLALKIDSIGNVLWSNLYHSGTSNVYHIPMKIMQTHDGGYLILATHQASTSFDDYYYLIKTDSLGNSNCSSPVSITTSNYQYIFNSSPPLNISNYPFSPTKANNVSNKGFGLTSVCTTSTEIEYAESPFFEVFPNPCVNKLSLRHNWNSETTIIVRDLLGRKINQTMLSSGREQLNILHWQAGIFFLEAIAENGNRVIRKIIKQ